MGKDKTPVDYKPLHPEIFKYDQEFVDRFLAPAVRNVKEHKGNIAEIKKVVNEVAEQLYQFDLFTEEFTKFLIEEAEHSGKWVTNLEKIEEPHPMTEGAVDVVEPDTSLSFDDLPGLEDVYGKIIENHVRPIVETLWKTFKLQKWDTPAIRKYEVDVVKQMDLHYDVEIVAMVGYLSKDFIGGGTHFPRWNITVGNNENVRVGSVVVYPGGVSHEHSALAITGGKRYMLANSFY
eukprot:TRINITY_DN5737_c0_g1_i1.p1 TRINITY_DN5737_c0_g1~~TRINITY_DN5737_c0_g1_i1.p1  ORF type:complete len:234 (-),score=74.59 TRINITY_DN5737_c0_g1_i1:69-770(-)